MVIVLVLRGDCGGGAVAWWWCGLVVPRGGGAEGWRWCCVVIVGVVLGGGAARW